MLAPPDGPVEPGAQAESVVLVRNTGEDADDFDVVVQGPASAWAAVEPRRLTLQPGEEAPAWVRFHPPRDTSTKPGATPFAVVVASRTDPSFAAIEEGSVDVTPFQAIRCALDPSPSDERGCNEFVLAVDNDGNATTRIEVDVVSAPEGATVEIDPDVVEVLPGTWAAIPVRVRARRIRGAPVLALRVTAAGGSIAVDLEGSLERDRSLASDIGRSAALLAGVLVLIVLGFVLVTGGRDSDDDGDRAPAALRTEQPPTTQEIAAEDTAPETTAAAAPAGPAPTAAASAAAGTAPADFGRIVFVRFYGEEKDIVVRSPGDANAELRLRADGSDERRPVLSPDGLRVAYVRLRGAEASVCVIPVTGGESACVAETTPSGAVAWRSDQRLLFTRDGSLTEIGTDGSEQVQLPVRVGSGRLAVSPDGNQIAFVNGGGISVRPLDGSQGVDLDVAGQPEDPSWSPDGSRIVYTENYQVRITPVGTGPVRTLTAGATVNGDPSWSRDGRWIVFRSNRSGNGDLYAVDPSRDGPEPDLRRITDAPERDANPSF